MDPVQPSEPGWNIMNPQYLFTNATAGPSAQSSISAAPAGQLNINPYHNHNLSSSIHVHTNPSHSTNTLSAPHLTREHAFYGGSPSALSSGTIVSLPNNDLPVHYLPNQTATNPFSNPTQRSAPLIHGLSSRKRQHSPDNYSLYWKNNPPGIINEWHRPEFQPSTSSYSNQSINPRLLQPPPADLYKIYNQQQPLENSTMILSSPASTAATGRSGCVPLPSLHSRTSSGVSGSTSPYRANGPETFPHSPYSPNDASGTGSFTVPINGDCATNGPVSLFSPSIQRRPSDDFAQVLDQQYDYSLGATQQQPGYLEVDSPSYTSVPNMCRQASAESGYPPGSSCSVGSSQDTTKPAGRPRKMARVEVDQAQLQAEIDHETPGASTSAPLPRPGRGVKRPQTKEERRSRNTLGQAKRRETQKEEWKRMNKELEDWRKYAGKLEALISPGQRDLIRTEVFGEEKGKE